MSCTYIYCSLTQVCRCRERFINYFLTIFYVFFCLYIPSVRHKLNLFWVVVLIFKAYYHISILMKIIFKHRNSFYLFTLLYFSISNTHLIENLNIVNSCLCFHFGTNIIYYHASRIESTHRFYTLNVLLTVGCFRLLWLQNIIKRQMKSIHVDTD